MARREQLVCQHLENISRGALEKYQGIIKQYIRGRHGIYALYSKKRLYYVGLASDLRFRLKQHLKDRHGGSWDRFGIYLTLMDSHLRELESLLLRVAKPVGNRQQGRFSSSEDLRHRFAREIRAHFRDELSALIGENVREDVLSLQEGRTPVLSRYPRRPSVLQAKFKGKFLQAKVLKDGRIRFGGKLYSSPSIAGAVACKRLTCNGWTFWSYERAPGDLVKLEELRNRR